MEQVKFLNAVPIITQFTVPDRKSLWDGADLSTFLVTQKGYTTKSIALVLLVGLDCDIKRARHLVLVCSWEPLYS